MGIGINAMQIPENTTVFLGVQDWQARALHNFPQFNPIHLPFLSRYEADILFSFSKILNEFFQIRPSFFQHTDIYSLFGDRYTSAEKEFIEIVKTWLKTFILLLAKIL